MVLTLALAKLSRLYWGWRLRRWASAEGVTLVSYRGAHSFEGPGAFARGENETLFRVEVADARGQRRSAWVWFGSRWGFVLGEPLARIDWD